jgi:thiamine biosynthesis protein ThiI
MNSHIVVHYGEIGTKGNNRAVFERQLERNLAVSLDGVPVSKIEKVNQRLLIGVETERLAEAMVRISRTFGVAWFADARIAGLSYDSIVQRALELAREGRAARKSSFRVDTRRANKEFPMTSHEVSVRLGDDIRRGTELKVDLSRADLSLHVDILDDRAVVYAEKRRGPGGLPVGVSGRVIHLLSGGIDSPAAAWLMMKRGCTPLYLHFYVAPDPKLVLESKIPELIKTLARYSGKSTLILLPFSPYQVSCVEVPSENEPVLFRYFMRLVAEKLAPEFQADGISTGDNLAQVASQTLQNLACIDMGSKLPVHRPLLSYDKEEIIELSKRIGTYETSIEPYKDCCTIVSRHPKTRLKQIAVEFYSREVDFEGLAEKTISQGALVSFDPHDESMLMRPLRAQATSVQR